MGRAVNQAHIVTRNARSKLPISKTVRWRVIDRGAHLGYRKGIDGGTWVARFRRPDGTYTTKAIGKAPVPANEGKATPKAARIRHSFFTCTSQYFPSRLRLFLWPRLRSAYGYKAGLLCSISRRRTRSEFNTLG